MALQFFMSKTASSSAFTQICHIFLLKNVTYSDSIETGDNTMSNVEAIEKKIEKLALGEVFSIDTLKIDRSPAGRQALSRLEKRGVIKRVKGGQGVYYIPKKGLLGDMKPTRSAVLKVVLNGKKRGYRTGVSLFNQLGLTTQVPGVVTIATGASPQTTTIGGVDVKLVRAKAPVTDENIPLLQILDVLSNISKIPDSSPDAAFDVIVDKIQELKKKDLRTMVGIATDYYPKRTQALLGAYLDSQGEERMAKQIKRGINPGTVYNIGLSEKVLPTKSKWNIQ